jgi:hypothetical protein
LNKRIDDNLKIKASKCSFSANKTKLKGFVISEYSIEPDDSQIKAMKNYPRTKQQVKRFLGLASYYRRFMPKLSKFIINKL